MVRFMVARAAERNQILFRIITQVATEFFVVSLKIRHSTARLASPAIATQDLLAQSLIGQRIQP